MTTPTTKRRGDRFPAPLKVYCSFERVEGSATLVDISYSGALLEHTTMRPGIGTPINLYVFLKPPRGTGAVAPSELPGMVVRHSSDGFAVKFEDNLDPDVRQMVDDAAALVTVQPHRAE